MRIFRTIRLIWTFYKSFFLLNFLVTLICIFIYWEYGLGIFFWLMLLKVATLWLTYYFIRTYKSNEFFYYQNLGLSKLMLWVPAIGFELLYFLLLFKLPKLI